MSTRTVKTPVTHTTAINKVLQYVTIATPKTEQKIKEIIQKEEAIIHYIYKTMEQLEPIGIPYKLQMSINQQLFDKVIVLSVIVDNTTKYNVLQREFKNTKPVRAKRLAIVINYSKKESYEKLTSPELPLQNKKNNDDIKRSG